MHWAMQEAFGKTIGEWVDLTSVSAYDAKTFGEAFIGFYEAMEPINPSGSYPEYKIHLSEDQMVVDELTAIECCRAAGLHALVRFRAMKTGIPWKPLFMSIYDIVYEDEWKTPV